jgi:FLVCR family MFS transporter 7
MSDLNLITSEVNNEADSANTSSLTSSVWKISSGKNGDKYLTFSGSNNSRFLQGDISINEDNSPAKNIRVYKMRWYILSVICLANIANAINWICYSAIADFTGRFYSIDYDQVNFLSLVYMIIAVPSGFFSFWFIDNFGIRTSINLGSWFNFIGAGMKLVTSIDSADGTPLIDKKYAYTVLMVGQCLCSIAQPFLIFVTTKFANSWFAEDQRALANTICLGSNTLGILIGAFISPQIVNSEVSFVSEMCLLHLVATGVSLFPALMGCFILRSTPKQPPSYSAILSNNNIPSAGNQYVSQAGEQENTTTFWQNFKIYLSECGKLLKSKDFIILFICFGFSLGLFNALSTLIQQMLCIRGYTDVDAGYFGGAMIVSGIVGSGIAGIILDKTKKFEETAKICFSLSTVANIAFVLIQLKDNDQSTNYYLILASFCLIGFFGLPLLPVCMEMAVECVYPIPEATSTGLLFITGQLVGLVMIVVYPKAADSISTDSYVYNFVQTCNKPANAGNSTTSTTTSAPIANLSVLDYKLPLYFQCFFQVVITIVFIVFFKCAYLRLRSEREKFAERILSSARQ